MQVCRPGNWLPQHPNLRPHRHQPHLADELIKALGIQLLTHRADASLAGLCGAVCEQSLRVRLRLEALAGDSRGRHKGRAHAHIIAT